MNSFIKWLQSSYKLVVALIGAIGILSAAIAIADKVATAEDVKKVQERTDRKIAQVEEKTAKTLGALNDRIELQTNVQRLKSLDDISVQLEMMRARDPKNQRLIKQQDKVNIERDQLLDKITNTKIGQ